MTAIAYAFAMMLAYLLGSIPSGLIAGRVTRGIDIRNYGSGATGTTNVLRTLGKGAAAVVLVADVLKGVVAVLVAKVLVGTALAEALAGSLAVAGHNWPFYISFRGGRGITVAVGGLAVMSPLAAGVGLLVFVSTVAASRYVSLGSAASVLAGMAAVFALVALHQMPSEHLVFAVTAGPMVLWRHRQNLQRLRRGTEPRLGQRTANPPPGPKKEGP